MAGDDNTTEAIAYWSKPEGGDEIDGYILQWTSTCGDFTQNYISHVKGEDKYCQLQTGLVPGEIYEMILLANNSAGFSREDIHHHQACT